jgi:hypothetical protein
LLQNRIVSSPDPKVGETFNDQRKHLRSPAHDLSEIILNGSKSGIACLIHDISDVGARLEVSCGELPKRFVLANYTKRTKTLCHLIWRDGRNLGVSFLSAPRTFTIDQGFRPADPVTINPMDSDPT